MMINLNRVPCVSRRPVSARCNLLTLRVFGVAVLAGCTNSTPTVEPPTIPGQLSGLQRVTFHVDRMNWRLQIL